MPTEKMSVKNIYNKDSYVKTNSIKNRELFLPIKGSPLFIYLAMNIHRILLDDNNPEHHELSIYRTGRINRVRLQDKSYKTYCSLEIGAHDYAAFFHYDLPQFLNRLPFISESGNGLDSWDEAFLHHSSLGSMNQIIAERRATINHQHNEIILLGWQDQPVGVAYFRDIDPAKFVVFLGKLIEFVEESAAAGCDLEFIL